MWRLNLPNLFVAFWYWTNTRSWAWLLVALNVRVEVVGRENIPRKGPLILASNHLNVADPPIITVKSPRRIAWMAKKELFDIPVLGILYHLYGCLPVRRFEADLAALRKSQEALERGLALGMFPEGTRSGVPGLRKGEPGTALIALRIGAPIVPVAITGTEVIKLPRALFNWASGKRPSVRLVFGEPFYLSKVERIRTPIVEEGAETIMRRIAELLPAEYRGIYGEATSSHAATGGKA